MKHANKEQLMKTEILKALDKYIAKEVVWPAFLKQNVIDCFYKLLESKENWLCER